MPNSDKRCGDCSIKQDDHDLLLRMHEQLASLCKLLLDNGQPGVITKHDTRIGSLETWRSMLVGAYLLLMAAMAIYAAVKPAGK